MELTEVWDIAKEAIIPLIGVIWVVFKQKIDDIASDLDKMEDKYRELEKKLVFVESTYATKAELAQMLNQINSTLMANNTALEQKIEKIMDLKNAPVQLMLEEITKRTQSKDKN
ncbi:lipoprotein [Escherichia phage phi92]|uniref:Phi92_gp149 n=3 Tax=Justusliebigvirus TaxID=2948775 RepID=I7HJE1_9CAUD|nr:lipoprotein [Escherichia phage phi92]YP_009984511.1 lipoprotein [Escherichia phage vB_EcoM_PHB05]UES35860.1 hypothetical protein sKKP3263_000096 [Serratia phage KKP_3264]UVF09811.1 hypothetical protein [Escherichia phage pEC-M2929-1AR.1]ATI15885.1 hypothetical protein [Escherichia phage vB_EcoM_PHB05]CBY99578.1 Phi92_gp149 [Escherichia phage phi92]